ncbi:signal peptidase I [Streptomyces sp. NPDC059373]
MGKRGRPRDGGDGIPDDDGYGFSDDQPRARRAGGRAERRKLAKKVKRKRRRSAAKEVPILIVVALLIALVLKTFLVQAFVIPSGSMEQTIKIGDRVLVDKLTPWFGNKVQRGDVVVFKDPGHWLDGEQTTTANDPVVIKQVKEAMTFIGLLPSANEQDLIKRVVAVGGDTVKCCDSQGRVTVNGVALNEPYIYPGNKPSDSEFSVKVPQGRLWVMGDHRANSADSRFHQQDFSGTVSESGVVGRAVVIAWPMSDWTKLSEPSTYASVPAAGGTSAAAAAASPSVSSEDRRYGTILLPSPAELPLVMGVVGLRRARGRPKWQRRVRSGREGFDGRRTIGTRRTRRRGRPGRRPVTRD